MATEKTDVVIVGVGAAGGILAAELGKAGMKVIGLERGPRLATKDFEPQDELRYFQRQDLRPDPEAPAGDLARERRICARGRLRRMSYGNQAGGGTVHYGAVSWRLHEDDFRARSQTIERYGAKAIPEDSSLVDWPMSYAELEPYLRPRRARARRVGYRPEICRAGKSTAAMCSKRRAGATIRCRR